MRIPKLNISYYKNMNKKRLIILASVVTAIIVLAFFAKLGFTAFIIKEKPSGCTDECDFEGKTCESAEIFECVLNEDGCRHKILIGPCPEGAKCSTLKEGECYKPNSCDGDFHICISDFLYQMCKNGKTIEDAETKKCPTGLMCNRNPKKFAICIEKDY